MYVAITMAKLLISPEKVQLEPVTALLTTLPHTITAMMMTAQLKIYSSIFNMTLSIAPKNFKCRFPLKRQSYLTNDLIHYYVTEMFRMSQIATALINPNYSLFSYMQLKKVSVCFDMVPYSLSEGISFPICWKNKDSIVLMTYFNNHYC